MERWDGLCLYATNGLLYIYNNPVENCIKPVAVGRKKKLFAASHAAVERAAIYYCLYALCKTQASNPYDRLNDTPDRLATLKLNQLHELLPQKRQGKKD